jgi:peptidyl-prolyl cis-trans isomerase C
MRWVMIKGIVMICSVFLITVSATFCNATDLGKGTVAVVNGKEISRASFERELAEAEKRIKQTGQSYDDKAMRKVSSDVLENLINNELLYQESVRKGYKANDLKAEIQLQRIKEQFGTEEQFLNTLKERGYTEKSLYEHIGRMIAIEDYIDSEIARKITISEEDARDYYNDNPDTFVQPEQVRASHILILVDDKTDDKKKKEAMKKIKEIQRKLKKGEEFDALAKEYSQGPSSERGGDLGYFSRGQMVKPFEESAFALEPGEVSDIVETQFGYHLIKLTDKKPERKIPFSEVKEDIVKYLVDMKIFGQVKVLIEKLREEAAIERLVGESNK